MNILFPLILLIFSTESKVYICDSGNSKVFHSNKHCPRLNKCKYKTITMSQSSAINDGYRKCKDKSE